MNSKTQTQDSRLVYLETQIQHHDEELLDLKKNQKELRNEMKTHDKEFEIFRSELQSTVHKIQLSGKGTMITIMVGLLAQLSAAFIFYISTN